jgi:hypothetical protein
MACFSSELRVWRRGSTEESDLRSAAGSLIVGLMSPTKTVVCSQCDRPEHQCQCDRYCCICAGFDRVKLGMDGLYYCPECMQACDVKLANRSDA